jgi:glycosyltransferase involved in cell wall biosynthesis
MTVPDSPLLSVIVPVAMGREPYTKLFSWLPLVEKLNIEVIINLDEFSQQASPTFLANLDAYKSPTLKVLRGRFGSPGLARNHGLEKVSGKWIAFWDSDDLPNPSSFIEMIEQAELKTCDVAVGSFTWTNEANPENVEKFLNPKTLNELIDSVGRTPGIWRFAIRRNLLVEEFSSLRMAEDQGFILSNQYFKHKVFISSEIVYQYFTGGEAHQTSIASNFQDLGYALQTTLKNFSKGDNYACRQLAAFFWFQQFGSNLKYGSGSDRIRVLLMGLKQIVFSSFQFKQVILLRIWSSLRKSKSQRGKLKVIVPLTGGLGNQLFQLSAAMALAKGSRVGLDSTIGAPRLNSRGQPEIASFKLPENIHLMTNANRSNLVKKSSGYLLRIGVSPKKFERLAIYAAPVTLMWNILIALSFKSLISATAGKGVGKFELKSRPFNQLIYGYFQSYVWPETSLKELQEIEPLHYSPELQNYRELAENEVPLIVHIRLGDYKLENTFGIPGKRYYSEAISEQWESGKYKKIWVFSDEPDAAFEYIPQEYQSKMRWIPEVDDSASQTLQVMRFGKGFVIGNSTFSWWGAFLAYNSNAVVIAPRPWFKSGDSPKALIPPGWKQIDAFKD